MDRCPFKQALRKNVTDTWCIDLKTKADIYEETFNFLSVTLTSSSLRNLMIIYHSLRLKPTFKYLSWNRTMESMTLLCTDVNWKLDKTFESSFAPSDRCLQVRYSVINSAQITSVRKAWLMINMRVCHPGKTCPLSVWSGVHIKRVNLRESYTRFSSGQTKLSVIYGYPYLAGVRRAVFHCNDPKNEWYMLMGTNHVSLSFLALQWLEIIICGQKYRIEQSHYVKSFRL